MTEPVSLERILQAAEANKTLLRHPLTTSDQNADVTVKYVISMLRIVKKVDEQNLEIVDVEKQKEIIDGFCTRFESDEAELRELISDPHNWVDYGLYSTLGVYLQEQLGLDDETFFDKVSEATFLDHSDKVISLASFGVTLNKVLKNMPIVFQNYTRVTEVKTEEVKRGQTTFRIRRRTLPQYKTKLHQLFGDEEIVKAILHRDCVQTQHSLAITFQKLYRQGDLKVITERSEIDPIEESEPESEPYSQYLIEPTSPYKTRIQNGLNYLGRFLVSNLLPWVDNHRLRKKNAQLQDSEIDREYKIKEMTAELKKQNAQLRERQDKVVGLLQEVSRLRASGERHGLRNFLQKVKDKEETIIRGQVRDTLLTFYNLVKDEKYKLNQFLELCSPFAITLDYMNSKDSLEFLLSNIDVDTKEKLESKDKAQKLDASGSEEIDLMDIFGEVLESKLDLDQAYTSFLSIRNSRMDEHYLQIWENFDPFNPLYTLRIIREVIAKAENSISKLGEVKLLDQYSLSQVVRNSYEEALRDKKGEGITFESDFSYDPTLQMDRVTAEQALRDLFYNSIEHGEASQIKISCINPAAAQNLPHLSELDFNEYPVAYICVEDNGKGISANICNNLNRFFRGENIDANIRSSRSDEQKSKGSGSTNLSRFTSLLEGKVYYEPNPNGPGTKVHIYLGRLGL